MSQPRSPIEDSLSFRTITAAMAMVGILAASQLANTPPGLTLFGIAGTIIGSFVSYTRRHKRNTWIKWAIILGILIVFASFIEEILYRIKLNVADAREPLTNMLIALQALHCFDLPTRRSLNVSALVGLTLVTSAATLSRDLTFALYVVAFMAFGTYMFYLDCLSRSTEHAIQSQSVSMLGKDTLFGLSLPNKYSKIAMLSTIPLLSIGLFLCIPKFNLGLMHNIRLSLPFTLRLPSADRIYNPLLTHHRRADGSLEVNPLAYYGFSQQLDLNYRGLLSDQVVVRVGSRAGHYWRGMAFDRYDGHRWTMSRPNATITRVAGESSAIVLSSLPFLSFPSRTRSQDTGQVFYLESDQPNLILAAAVPYQLYFPSGNIAVDEYGSLRSPSVMEHDTMYTVFSLVPNFNISQLRKMSELNEEAAQRINKRYSNYLRLPVNLPDKVRALAAEVVGESGNSFVKAERINYFLQRTYKYNLKIPPTDEQKDVVTDFLFDQKEGYCEHFASAFVVLCRTQGIPARLVTGFTPGEYNPFTGLWEVKMLDAHAWAEVFIPTVGWMPFDPTPGGPLPGLPEVKSSSPGNYLLDQLASFTQKLIDLPQVKALLNSIGTALSKLLVPVAIAFGPIIHWLAKTLWPVASALSVALMASLFYQMYKRGQTNKQLKSAAKSSDYRLATRDYLQVLGDLEKLKVRRSPSDTADELSDKVRAAQPFVAAEDLPKLIDDFANDYSESRFGTPDNMKDLAPLAGEIHQQVVQNLAQRRFLALSAKGKTPSKPTNMSKND
ncbi:MAG: transglutaminaseTgpA domain-containing protein [Candidatus Obscuribacterales bacterium]|nr:transglutaminaseTgpA domain-containing protein [Candidatus Obscuribacterales bacterium]